MINDPRDFTNKYNTQLSPKQEAQFLQDMKDRLNDLYDYDLRGAWLELQNDNMSKDARGHLGDKYKKPNHITFSDESKYHGVDGYKGGHWSEDSPNSFTFTPSENMLYNDEERQKYWMQGDEYSSGNHLNNSKGKRLVNGFNPSREEPSGLVDYITSMNKETKDTVNKIAKDPAVQGLVNTIVDNPIVSTISDVINNPYFQRGMSDIAPLASMLVAPEYLALRYGTNAARGLAGLGSYTQERVEDILDKAINSHEVSAGLALQDTYENSKKVKNALRLLPR